MLKSILLRLSQFFQDDTGALSAMRLLLIGWSITVLVIWSVLSIKTVTLVPIPPSVLTWLGTLIGGKMIQNYTERS